MHQRLSCVWREAGAPAGAAAPSRKAAIGDRSGTRGSAPVRMPASCISDRREAGAPSRKEAIGDHARLAPARMPASCISDSERLSCYRREAGAPAAPSRKAAIGDRSSTRGSPPARMQASCLSDSAATGGRALRGRRARRALAKGDHARLARARMPASCLSDRRDEGGPAAPSASCISKLTATKLRLEGGP
jgi:hypothetical protein